MPRRYQLRRRAERMSETRAAIVRAALELIRAGGLGSATVPAIARASDVAPATVRNHFPDQAELLVEVGDLILRDLDLPDVGIFDGLASTSDRVTRLARELVEFYGRGQTWWFIFTADAAMAPAFERSAARYEARFDELVRASLGPMVDDDVAFAMVASVIGPPLHYALVARGVAADVVVETSLAMLLPWLEAREEQRRRHRRRRTRGS